MRTRSWSILLAALLCQGCLGFLPGFGDDDNNGGDNNTVNGTTNGSSNNDDQAPSWEVCSEETSLDLELTESDALEDPFSGLELGYVRAYFNPLLNMTLLVFMLSESDDLEDAGDHTTMLFTATLTEFEPSGTREIPVGEIINQLHFQFSQIKKRGTLGIDRPRYETRELTVSWDTENDPFEVGERISGEFDITLGAACYAHDGSLSYHGTFDTVLLPYTARDTLPCDTEDISGDWDTSLSVGELDVFADGRRVEFETHRVYIDADGVFKIFAYGGEDDQESTIQLTLDDAQPGENVVPLVAAGFYGCAAGGEQVPLMLDEPESGSLAEGPNTGAIDTEMVSGADGCDETVHVEAEFTYGWCRE